MARLEHVTDKAGVCFRDRIVCTKILEKVEFYDSDIGIESQKATHLNQLFSVGPSLAP
jgi:hypothetical protein